MKKNIDIDKLTLTKLKIISASENMSVKALMEKAIRFFVEQKENELFNKMTQEEKEDLGLLILMQQPVRNKTVKSIDEEKKNISSSQNKLISAALGTVKDDFTYSFYVDETLNETNGSIVAFLIFLITEEKLKEKPNQEYIDKLNKELQEYPKQIKEQFQSKEEADKFLKPLLKREKELFELLPSYLQKIKNKKHLLKGVKEVKEGKTTKINIEDL